MKTLAPEELGRVRVTCTTQPAVIVAYLWYVEEWVPTHQLQNRETPFGFIGSAGHTRVRELARNAPAIPEKLHNKVERERGGRIGLDPKFEYFRWKSAPRDLTRAEILKANAENVRAFDAA